MRVLVADGQRLFAEALGRALQQYPDFEVLLQETRSGRDVLEASIRRRPDVLLLDYWILEMDGPAVTRELRSRGDAPKVLLMSWIHGPDEVQQALIAGAAGFLPKSVTIDQVAEAIRQALVGHPLVYAPQLAGLFDDMNRRLAETEAIYNAVVALTPREIETLQLLAEGRPTKQIATELSIAPGTLKNLIHNILSKMRARTRVEAVDTARRVGLISVPPPTASPPSH